MIITSWYHLSHIVERWDESWDQFKRPGLNTKLSVLVTSARVSPSGCVKIQSVPMPCWGLSDRDILRHLNHHGRKLVDALSLDPKGPELTLAPSKHLPRQRCDNCMIAATANTRDSFVLLHEILNKHWRVFTLDVLTNSKLPEAVTSYGVKVIEVSDESCMFLTTRYFSNGDTVCAESW